MLATYLAENQKYLDLALRSIKAQENVDIETIVVSSGDHIPTVPDWVQHIHSADRLHYPSAINLGVKHTDQNSKYIMLLNDDVVLTKNALHEMSECCGDRDFILNPISNCDNHWLYLFVPTILGKDGNLVHFPERFYRWDDWAPYHDELITQVSRHPRFIWQAPMVCFYATMIPRKVWNVVGELDANFKTGYDDQDYSVRAREKKISLGIAASALIWHSGGVTADIAITQDDRKFNVEYYNTKWKNT